MTCASTPDAVQPVENNAASKLYQQEIPNLTVNHLQQIVINVAYFSLIVTVISSSVLVSVLVTAISTAIITSIIVWCVMRPHHDKPPVTTPSPPSAGGGGGVIELVQ